MTQVEAIDALLALVTQMKADLGFNVASAIYTKILIKEFPPIKAKID